MAESIPDDVRRFILTSVPSVPHLEAILLLRAEVAPPWDSRRLARRLYLSEKTAESLLNDLCAAGALTIADQETRLYSYHPNSKDLRQIIDRVAAVYAKHIVDITHLIHSTTGKKAQQFADAFKLRED